MLIAENVRDRVAAFRNAQAVSFDDEPDHGRSDEIVLEARMARSRSWLLAPWVLASRKPVSRRVIRCMTLTDAAPGVPPERRYARQG